MSLIKPRYLYGVSAPHRKIFLIFGSLIFISVLLFTFYTYHLPNSPSSLSFVHPLPKSNYAYIQYATTLDYLCNSALIFSTLHLHSTPHTLLLLYRNSWTLNPSFFPEEYRLLNLLQARYNVILKPIEIQRRDDDREETWAEGFTKLLAWDQTDYSRVLLLDSDALLLKPLDHLFSLLDGPVGETKGKVAMPLAYWLNDQNPQPATSAMILLQPDRGTFEGLMGLYRNTTEREFDMEVVNAYFGSEGYVKIPHQRGNFVLSGEWRRERGDHAAYLNAAPGEVREAGELDKMDKMDEMDEMDAVEKETSRWNPGKALAEARYVHFSDWPLPKPWFWGDEKVLEEVRPKCLKGDGAVGRVQREGTELRREVKEDCADREMWEWIYGEFRRRRRDFCGMGTRGFD